MTMTTNALATSLRPRYEGANMGTLIGFKHMLYLVEEAVLDWFRHRGFGPHRLLHEHGLALQLVDTSARLVRVLTIDDEATAYVRARKPGHFSVTLTTYRDGTEVTILRARVTAELFAPDKTAPHTTLPNDLASLLTHSADTSAAAQRHNHPLPAGEDPGVLLAPNGSERFWWSWKARYTYCHYFDRVQHSGYIRTLEETVDRFLAARGIGIVTILKDRGWVPVVSKVHVQLLTAAHIDETIHTTFAVEGVSAGRTYEARMDCHAERDGELVHTATATITHGYIKAGDVHVQALTLGDDITAALRGR
ncbi:thioesterase family protein [Streptomyces sp. 8N616]|uniref:thioesterase family protein n=1 Tax=Streptomyces sp. 8N616 TaxID=3457414 RepID=UPI003FD24847